MGASHTRSLSSPANEDRITNANVTRSTKRAPFHNWRVAKAQELHLFLQRLILCSSERALWAHAHSPGGLRHPVQQRATRKIRSVAGKRCSLQLSRDWQNGPASINCSDFLLNNHAVEPRLFEPKSLLPGNGILQAETKAPKRLRKTKETIAET
jgi:hypothetical protein